MTNTRKKMRGFFVSLTAAALIFSTGCGVLLDLLVSPEISVSTHNLSFTATESTNPDSQQITAECTALDSDTSISEDCEALITTNQDWLSTSPTEILGLETVTVSINVEGLAPGTYTGNIHVEYILVSIDDEEDVSVELTVNPAP